MLEERRQNLAKTDMGCYYNQKEWLEEFLDDKGAFYNGIESDDSDNGDKNYKNYNKNSRANVLQNSCF